MKSVGIIGGLGPETTAEFYMNIIKKNSKQSIGHPRILIHNVPMPFSLEEDIVKNSKSEDKLLPLLIEGLDILQDKVDFIVIPCNTAHIFVDEVRKKSRIPVLSIIEEVAKEVKNGNLKKVGILATSKTIQSKIFDSKLIASNIQCVNPDEDDQRRISEIIHLILKGMKSKELTLELLEIVNKLEDKGAEAIVLGCTDLQLLLKQTDSPIKLIDTMEVLADSVVKLINQKDNVGRF